jgi:hypothetical protein
MAMGKSEMALGEKLEPMGRNEMPMLECRMAM